MSQKSLGYFNFYCNCKPIYGILLFQPAVLDVINESYMHSVPKGMSAGQMGFHSNSTRVSMVIVQLGVYNAVVYNQKVIQLMLFFFTFYDGT